MIKTQNMVPETYYKQSRDFQLFGRIYDVMFNYIKNNSNAVEDIANSISPNQQTLELLANTLGFKTKHHYNVKELSALCSIFIDCIRKKGSRIAILLLLKMICSVQNSRSEPLIWDEYSSDLLLIIPSDIKDWTLIRDVLDYIMPCGTSYSLISQDIESMQLVSLFGVSSSVNSKNVWSATNSSVVKFKENVDRPTAENTIINNELQLSKNGTEIWVNNQPNDVDIADTVVFTTNNNTALTREELEQINKDILKSVTEEN